MNQNVRRELISKNLGIIPINHGQVYTFQVALPETKKQDISLERYQAIEQSLLQHQSNLISLVIRRTDAYTDEDIEYEIVYGADWLQVAQDLNIDRVWAWVFDMTDEQAEAARAEMAQLAYSPLTEPQPLASPASVAENLVQSTDRDLETVIDRKLKLATDSTKQVLLASLDQFKNNIEEQLRTVHHRFDRLSADLSAIPALLSQIETLHQQLASVKLKTPSKIPAFAGPKVNLRLASHLEIRNALEQLHTQDKHIDAAVEAITYWKQPGRELSWHNLTRSAKAKRGSAYKIDNFADGTYQKLWAVGEISDQ